VDELIILYMQSAGALLRGLNLPDSVIKTLLGAIEDGSILTGGNAQQGLTALGVVFAEPLLADLLMQLAEVTEHLRRDEVSAADL
jgi:hypothetical protein